MFRWFLTGGLGVYLAGLFGFGLFHQFTRSDVGILDAIGYGARWPDILLRML